MDDFPVTTERSGQDPTLVVVDLDALRADDTDECDGHSLALTPERASALAAALFSKALAVRLGRPADITFETGDPTP